MLTRFLFVLIFSTSWANQPHPLPRFASLRSNSAHMHVGPGNNYPIEWRFVRQGLPIEIIAEFDTWRRIRDHQGTEGWVHQSLLSGKRTIIIMGNVQNIYSKPDEQSDIVARAEPGVVATVIETQANWCKIEVRNDQGRFKGWVSRQQVWGLYANEIKV
ncbi:MAG: SH3 domain-containing protein [Pseudomonadota bacterium]|jgi:SH3-like domain-containing protein|nr:SH3 domain-containing protein [Alphaproteobacteria bacterium]